MEIRIYSIKLSPPRWLRHALVYAVLPAGVLLGATTAVRAAVNLTKFTAGTPIAADDVNANFKTLGDAVSALQTTTPSEWVTYDPKIVAPDATTAIDGVKTCKGVYRIVGDTLEVRTYTEIGSTKPTSTAQFSITLPPGKNVDMTKLAGGAIGFPYRNAVGVAVWGSASANASQTGFIGTMPNTNIVVPSFQSGVAGNALGAGDVLYTSFSVPIQ
ncbi:MAG TPA: hypothetical protein VGM29_11355 [Polyangiaceae bacterium]